MKIRQGFVSNSSSSSYIVGVGLIEDKEKLLNYIKEHSIDIDSSYNAGQILKISEITNNWDFNKSNDKITVDGFCASVSTKYENEDDEIFAVIISNDEGDGEFWDEGMDELDYDIDLSFFNENQQKLYNIFYDEKSGLKNCDCTFGAARNG